MVFERFEWFLFGERWFFSGFEWFLVGERWFFSGFERFLVGDRWSGFHLTRKVNFEQGISSNGPPSVYAQVGRTGLLKMSGAGNMVHTVP